MFTLDDLMEIRVFDKVSNTFGNLKVAEILVEDAVFELDKATAQNWGSRKSTYVLPFYLKGRVKTGEVVRTTRRFVSQNYDKKIEVENLLDIGYAEISNKLPSKGVIIPVYWYSEDVLPKLFKGEIYINKLLNEDFRPFAHPNPISFSDFIFLTNTDDVRRAKGYADNRERLISSLTKSQSALSHVSISDVFSDDLADDLADVRGQISKLDIEKSKDYSSMSAEQIKMALIQNDVMTPKLCSMIEDSSVDTDICFRTATGSFEALRFVYRSVLNSIQAKFQVLELVENAKQIYFNNLEEIFTEIVKRGNRITPVDIHVAIELARDHSLSSVVSTSVKAFLGGRAGKSKK